MADRWTGGLMHAEMLSVERSALALAKALARLNELRQEERSAVNARSSAEDIHQKATANFHRCVEAVHAKAAKIQSSVQ